MNFLGRVITAGRIPRLEIALPQGPEDYGIVPGSEGPLAYRQLQRQSQVTELADELGAGSAVA